MGREGNELLPNIGFIIETFNGQLNAFVDGVIEASKILLGENYVLTHRSNFNTLNNLAGEKIIANITLREESFRQVAYFFPGKDNKFIMIVCGAPAEIEDAFDKIFDKSIKTFEWTNSIASNPRYFIEETGRFMLTPPEPWQEIKYPDFKYKELRLGQSRNISFINFDVVSTDRQLSEHVDIVLEDMNNILGEKFTFLQRGDFITKNIKGEKIIVNLLINGERTLRNVIYYFYGKNDMIYSIVCITLAEAGDSYDDMFDKLIDTFEWID